MNRGILFIGLREIPSKNIFHSISEIGVKVELSNNADLLISSGYRYQEFKSKALQSYTYDSQEYYNCWDSKENLNRLVFGLAVMFK